MSSNSVSARLVGLATALVLLFGAVTAPPSLAKAACNNGGPGVAGTADIALVQSVSGTSGVNLVDHVTITNYGPCNVPNAGLTVTLPGALVSYRSNPNSWICDAAGTTVTCYETATIGVPGTADIYLEYATSSGLISACAATFGTVGQLASCPSSGGSVPDPNTANNTSTVAAGFLGAGGTLTYAPAGLVAPNHGFDHTTAVTLANGGLVNIYQLAGCPSGVPSCFLGTIAINFTNVNGAKTWTLSFLASLAGKTSLSQITVWNSVGGGTFSALSNCSGKHPTDPCVQDRVRSTNADGDTVYTITVQGTVDNGMTAD